MRFAINRSWLLLGVALALGGLSAYGVKRYIEQHVEEIEARGRSKQMVKIVVPKEDLPKGTVLREANVAVREVPQEWAHSNALETMSSLIWLHMQQFHMPSIIMVGW